MGAAEDRGDGEEATVQASVGGTGALFPKLRPGPGRSTDQVIANQRARLIGAMVELVSDRGYEGVTVRGLSRLAGVSTKAFYDCFRNVEDCFVATHARIVRDTLARATGTTLGPEDQPRPQIRAFFSALVEEPKAARLVLIDAPAAGSRLVDRTRAANRALERSIGAEIAPAVASGPDRRRIAEGAVAAGLHLARSRLLASPSQSPVQIADRFVDWLLTLRGGPSLEESAYVADAGSSAQHTPEIGDDRGFLLAAALRLSLREGYSALTVSDICREAGVPRRSFDKHFDGIANCFLAAVECRFAESVVRAIHSARAAAGSWEQAVAQAVIHLCSELALEPGLAHLSLVDALVPGDPALDLRDRMIVRLARLFRQSVPDHFRPGQLAAEASIAAAMKIAAVEAAAGSADRFARATPVVAFVILAPAAGADVAHRTIVGEMKAPPTREFGDRKHSTHAS